MRGIVCALLVAIAGSAQAVELQLPTTAQQMATRNTTLDRYFAPVGPFSEGELPSRMIDGAVARSTWRIDVEGLTPLQIIAPLREQLTQAGYELALDCAANECGGYDFRFETEVLPAPNMYINIRNYHVITGLSEGEAVTVIASASSGASFIQIIQASAESAVDMPVSAPAPSQQVQTGGLLDAGYVLLGGLEFDSGTTELGQGPFASLEALAEVMRTQPQIRVSLVGHTDNVGGLDVNTALSVDRAEAVRRHLIARYDIAADRLEMDGIGFLAPRASNLTAEGRDANRRVEAVLLAE
jgi:OOP family OmpA-OmpF porin